MKIYDLMRTIWGMITVGNLPEFRLYLFIILKPKDSPCWIEIIVLDDNRQY